MAEQSSRPAAHPLRCRALVDEQVELLAKVLADSGDILEIKNSLVQRALELPNR